MVVFPQASSAPRPRRKVLANHEPVSVRRRNRELAHAMRLVCRRLLYQRAAPDEFFIKCIDVIHMQHRISFLRSSRHGKL